MSSGCVKRRGSVTTWMNSASTCGAIAMTSPAESTCASVARAASVLGVLSYLRGHKEPGVEAMDHGRPSSISPSRSSSDVSGRSTEPKPTVAMSRTLCDREPSIRGAGDTVPCASTVTSCPSGNRTPLSSTTTPSCTRPRTTATGWAGRLRRNGSDSARSLMAACARHLNDCHEPRAGHQSGQRGRGSRSPSIDARWGRPRTLPSRSMSWAAERRVAVLGHRLAETRRRAPGVGIDRGREGRPGLPPTPDPGRRAG